MSPPLLPLFPLSLVLLPGMALPLHIFEERYKEMFADVVPTSGEFGIVLAKGEGIVNIGCSAVVRSVFRRYKDGRLDLVATGQRRFMIEGLNQSRSYLQAEVEYFDDEQGAETPLELRQRALEAFAPLLTAQQPAESTIEPLSSALSFRLGELIEDVDKKQTVLSLRSETDRLEYLLKVVPDYLIRQERTELARRVGPLNGHAKYAKPGN